jgi:hypothetical protein
MDNRRPKQEVSTSIHAPIMRELAPGKFFEAKLTRPVFRCLKETADKIKEIANLEDSGFEISLLVFDQLEAIFGAPPEVVDQIDFKDANELIRGVMKEAFPAAPAPAEAETEEEKPLKIKN